MDEVINNEKSTSVIINKSKLKDYLRSDKIVQKEMKEITKI